MGDSTTMKIKQMYFLVDDIYRMPFGTPGITEVTIEDLELPRVHQEEACYVALVLFVDDLAVWCCASKEELFELNTVPNKSLERLEVWCLENNKTINLGELLVSCDVPPLGSTSLEVSASHTTQYDDEIESIHLALHQLSARLSTPNKVVSLSDSSSVLQALASNEDKQSSRVQDCWELLSSRNPTKSGNGHVSSTPNIHSYIAVKIAAAWIASKSAIPPASLGNAAKREMVTCCSERKKKKKNWIRDRHNVVFSDESQSFVQYSDDRIRVWRLRGDNSSPVCVLHPHKVPASDEILQHTLDLSLFENIWSWVAERRASHPSPAYAVEKVWHGFEVTWNELPISVIQAQFDFIPNRFGLAIHQNDHQARLRFVEWAQNEIAVVPDFHKRILFSDEAHFWLNGYVNKQNCRIWSEANPQVHVEIPLHPEKLTVWCALWAGGILLQKR
ncbi:uncharacterized protein TNCV_2206151 [Trichonephila clavipes]|nr:uncharacterized protein TNCV_2206151 [Trichonephila clavipes]